MIKSRFSFGVYSIFIIFFAVLVGGICLLMHPELRFHHKFGGTNGPMFPALLLIGASLAILYIYITKLTVIILGANGILLRQLFRNRQIDRKEIKAIDLFSRQQIWWSFQDSGEALAIECEDGKRLYFMDSFYRNMPEVKGAIKAGFPDLSGDVPTKRSSSVIPGDDPGPADLDSMEKFSGNYLTNLNGISFWGLTAILATILLKSDPSGLLFIFVLVPELAMYLLLGSQLFYFRLSDEYLVVCNHLFFWYKKVYRMDNIHGMVFESPDKRANSLRIRTNDFRSKGFAAGSLRKDDWLALGRRLKEFSIPVMSEIIGVCG